MKADTPAMADIAALRECLYRLFSACLLGAPTSWVREAFRNPEWRAALGRLLDCPTSTLSRDLLQEGSPYALAVEHAALFLVPASQTLPFESAYAAGPQSATLMGVTAGQVAQIYRSWGLNPAAETHELPDHAATMLLFMALLIRAEMHLRNQKDEAGLGAVLRQQAEFLDQHILTWFPRWLDRVRQSARLPFYRVLADLLERFLEKDGRTLGVAPASCRPLLKLKELPAGSRRYRGTDLAS